MEKSFFGGISLQVSQEETEDFLHLNEDRYPKAVKCFRITKQVAPKGYVKESRVGVIRDYRLWAGPLNFGIGIYSTEGWCLTG